MKKVFIIFAILLAFAPRGYGATGVGTFNYLIEHDDLEKLKILTKGAKPGKDTRHPKTGLTSLMVAALNGSMNVAKYLLSMGSQVNMTDTSGSAPLIHAAMSGKVEMIKLLLDKGANINAMNEYKVNALNYAITYERWDAAKYLLSRGIQCNYLDIDGVTLTHRAAAWGNTEIVKLLVQRGAAFDVRDSKKGITPFQVACENAHGAGSRDTALYLLSLGANINNRGSAWNDTPLYWALWGGMNDVAKMLIDRGADLTVVFEDRKNEHVRNGSTMLMAATSAKNADLDICKLLVAKGADVNHVSAYGKTALWYAAYFENEKTTRWLLDNGADPGKGCDTQRGMTPLHVAAVKGHLGILKMLYRKGMDIDVRSKSGSTPLMYAASAGHQEVVEWLIGKGADMKANNAENSDAFVQAATRGTAGHAGIAELLLKKEAGDPNSIFRGGETVLMFSAKRSDNDMVRLLLKYGARVNAVEKKTNDTALHYAAVYGDVQTVKLMLDAGANPNAALPDGTTPLFDAVENRDPRKVRALLDAGAGPNAVMTSRSTVLRPKSCTPLFYAVEINRPDITGMLIAAGAKVNVMFKYFGERMITPLGYAIEKGNSGNVALLVARGADVNDESISIANSIKKGKGCLEIVTLLMNKRRDPDVNATDQWGEPLLHIAVNNNLDIVKFLLEKGADINARDKYGFTAVGHASGETLDYLLGKGADPGMRDYNGNTPIINSVIAYCEEKKLLGWRAHHSTFDEYFKRMKIILDTGKIDINALNKEGKTALMIATQAKEKALIDFLRKAGAVR